MTTTNYADITTDMVLDFLHALDPTKRNPGIAEDGRHLENCLYKVPGTQEPSCIAAQVFHRFLLKGDWEILGEGSQADDVAMEFEWPEDVGNLLMDVQYAADMGDSWGRAISHGFDAE